MDINDIMPGYNLKENPTANGIELTFINSKLVGTIDNIEVYCTNQLDNLITFCLLDKKLKILSYICISNNISKFGYHILEKFWVSESGNKGLFTSILAFIVKKLKISLIVDKSILAESDIITMNSSQHFNVSELFISDSENEIVIKLSYEYSKKNNIFSKKSKLIVEDGKYGNNAPIFGEGYEYNLYTTIDLAETIWK